MEAREWARLPIQIVLITHFYPAHRGGVEMVAARIAQGLSADGDLRIEWFASNTDPSPAPDKIRVSPANTWNGIERRTGIPFPLWSPGSMLRLIKAILRADCVHLHDTLYFANSIAGWIAVLVGKPLIITQHIGMIPYRSRVLRAVLEAANRMIAIPLLQRARSVLFVSPVVEAYFRDRSYRPITGVWLPNGVDTTLFAPASPEQRARLRNSLGMPGDATVLLFVGRHVERKGLEIIRSMARSQPDSHWYLIGSGPINPDFWSLPNVTCVGPLTQAEIVPYYQTADVLVLPSVGEGFPLVVQEAMSCGLLPIVDKEVAAAGDLNEEVAIIEPIQGADVARRWWDRIAHQLTYAETVRQLQRQAISNFARARWSWEGAVKTYASAIRRHTRGNTAP